MQSQGKHRNHRVAKNTERGSFAVTILQSQRFSRSNVRFFKSVELMACCLTAFSGRTNRIPPIVVLRESFRVQLS